MISIASSLDLAVSILFLVEFRVYSGHLVSKASTTFKPIIINGIVMFYLKWKTNYTHKSNTLGK